MINLTKKLIPFVLAGALLGGCASYSPAVPVETPENLSLDYTNVKPAHYPDKPGLINLRNGYYARTPKAAENIDLTTSAFLGEVFLTRENNGQYTRINTRIYGSTSELVWNSQFDESCLFADDNNDKILEEDETQRLLDLTYNTIEDKRRNDIPWVEDDEE